jgi:hypothetical protein
MRRAADVTGFSLALLSLDTVDKVRSMVRIRTGRADRGRRLQEPAIVGEQSGIDATGVAEVPLGGWE